MLAVLTVASCGRLHFDAGPASDVDADAAVDTGLFARVPLPAGGFVEGITIGSQPDQAYAWFFAGRVFRTDDAGHSWVECPREVGDHMAVAANGTVYLALNRDEILMSHDACASWLSTSPGFYAGKLAAAGNRVFAAAEGGLRVHDGVQWSVIDSPFEGSTVRAVALQGDTILIASHGQGVARSVDGGAQWTIHTAGLSNLRVTVLVIAPSNPQRVWAIEQAGGLTTGAAYRSDDGGTSWVSVFDNGGYDIAVDPANPDRALFANYNTLLETTNATTFTDIRTPEMASADTYRVRFDQSGGAYAATARGVFYRPSAGAFEPRHGTLDVWNLRAAASTPARDVVYFATSAGLLRSDDGETFEHVTQGLGALPDVVVPASDPEVVLTSGAAVWHSIDRGRSFAQLWVPGAADNYHVGALALAGDRLFGATRTQVVYADPPWTTWTAVQLGGAARNVDDIAALTDGQVIACASGTVYASGDRGQSFAPIAGAPPNPRRVFGAADGTLLLATNEGLWAHAGGVWSLRLQRPISDVLVEQASWTAATPDGLFVSRDGGGTWEPEPGLAGLAPLALARDRAGRLLVGTAAYGLFRAAP
jgi:hypothetical protein